MNEHSRCLIAALAIVAATGCGQQQPTQGNASEPAVDLSVPSAGPASGNALEQDGEPDSGPAPSDGAEAASNAREADRPEDWNREEAFDPRNSEFTIDGSRIVLKNGLSRAPAAPGSAGLVSTRYSGREASGDLNGDGRDDLAWFVTRDGAGSGRFTYVVAAIKGPAGHKTTNAFLVGDRIEPQSLRISARELHVGFAGREKGEPMTAPATRPSILLLKVTPQGRLEGLMR